MTKLSTCAVANNSGNTSNAGSAAGAGATTRSQVKASASASSSQPGPSSKLDASSGAVPAAGLVAPSPETNAAAAEIAAHPHRRYSVQSIRSHQLDNETFTVDLEIQWTNGDITIEDEAFMQRWIPDLLFKYWGDLGGRDQATGFDQWHVFKIHEHCYVNKVREYLVQWVGFCENDCTWEPEAKLADIAPYVKAKYDRAKKLKN